MNKTQRVVASCTTLPTRYSTLINVLKSLKNQTYPLDEIYLTLPYVAKRSNTPYPNPPEALKKLCNIVRCETDYGPLCKLYGALTQEKNPNTMIITIDDDMIYPPDLVESLVNHSNIDSNVAICGSGALLKYGILCMSYYTNDQEGSRMNKSNGFYIPADGRYIDLVYGFSGVLYKRSFFPSEDKLYNKLLQYPLIDNSIFCNDDVLISGYLKKNNIKMKIFKDIPLVLTTTKNTDALSYDHIKMLIRLNDCVKKVKKHGMFLCYEHQRFDESLAGKYIILFLFIIVIIIIGIILSQI